MRVNDLPLDLISQRVIRVVPLKGARAEEEARVVLVSAATARAVAAYLRARRYHRLADSPGASSCPEDGARPGVTPGPTTGSGSR